MTSPDELLRRRVERLEEMLVSATASFDDDPSLDPRLLRREARRHHLALVPEVSDRLRQRQRERTPRMAWDGVNLAELKEFVGDRASLVLDRGRLTVVCQGKTALLERGRYLEIDPDFNVVRIGHGDEEEDIYDEARQSYRTAWNSVREHGV